MNSHFKHNPRPAARQNGMLRPAEAQRRDPLMAERSKLGPDRVGR